MSIVISLDHVIFTGIFIAALIVLLLIFMGRNFSFSWKVFFTFFGCVVIGFLLYMGNYAVHHAFNSHSVCIEPSANVPQDKLISVESYKATYDLFSTHFSQLLTFLGFFGTIFGLAIPAGAYLLQRQTLKDEKAILQKNIDQTYNKVIELMGKYEELKQFKDQMYVTIDTINEKNVNLEHFQHELFMNLQTTFDGVFSIALFLVDAIPEKEKIKNLFCMMLISFDNAVNCAVKANNSKGLIQLLRRMKPIIEIYYKEKYPSEFRQAITAIKPDAENNSAFVSGEEIQKLLGNENYELYEWYKELYNPIYPWKFNGQQKKV